MDAVLLVGSVVFVIEFKVGQAIFDQAVVDRVWDYALDLKTFTKIAAKFSLVPIFSSTEEAEC